LQVENYRARESKCRPTIGLFGKSHAMWRYFVLRLFISFVLFISLDKLWAQDFTDSEARDCTDLTEIEGRGGREHDYRQSFISSGKPGKYAGGNAGLGHIKTQHIIYGLG